MPDNKEEYLGDFGGAPKDGPKRGEAAHEERQKGEQKAEGKAVDAPPATKAVRAPRETK